MSTHIYPRWGLNQKQRQGPTLVHSQVTGTELQVTEGGFWGVDKNVPLIEALCKGRPRVEVGADIERKPSGKAAPSSP